MAIARNRTLHSICSSLVLVLVAVLGSLSLHAADQAAFVVVAHPGVPDATVAKQDLSDMFLKKRTSWSDGSAVLPVTSSNRELDNAFSEAIHGRSTAALKKFWQRQIFSGEGFPPPERATDQEVLDFVRSTPGAVGVVSARASLTSAGVRVLSVR